MEITKQLEALIKLALIDNNLSNFEKRAIYSLGKANKIPERKIDTIFNQILKQKEIEAPGISPMSDEEKLDFLYSIVQLMKVDKKVYLSEIKFCEEMAVKLGYRAGVVSQFSSRVYSDPAIISDRQELQNLLLKYKLEQ